MIRRRLVERNGEIVMERSVNWYAFALFCAVALSLMSHLVDIDVYDDDDCELWSDSYMFSTVWCIDDVVQSVRSVRICDYNKLRPTDDDCAQISSAAPGCGADEIGIRHVCEYPWTRLVLYFR